MSSHVDRTIAAEARAIEEGHHAWLDGRSIFVVSDTDERLGYTVTASALGDRSVSFVCQPVNRRTRVPVEATHRRLVGHPAQTPCKHCALAARRLEREGLVEWHDGWFVPPAVFDAWQAQIVADAQPVFDKLAAGSNDDPFACFPKL